MVKEHVLSTLLIGEALIVSALHMLAMGARVIGRVFTVTFGMYLDIAPDCKLAALALPKSRQECLAKVGTQSMPM